MPEVLARTDAQLHEHLAKVPLDRADAEEQLRADLGVRAPVSGQPGDVLLLGCELVSRGEIALAYLLACGQELPARPLGEPLGSYGRERVVRGSELLTRIDAPALATKATRRTAGGLVRARFETACGRVALPLRRTSDSASSPSVTSARERAATAEHQGAHPDHRRRRRHRHAGARRRDVQNDPRCAVVCCSAFRSRRHAEGDDPDVPAGRCRRRGVAGPCHIACFAPWHPAQPKLARAEQASLER